MARTNSDNRDDLSLQIPGRPEEMDYFLRVAGQMPITPDALAAAKEGRKLVGLLCGSVPEELVFAAGGFPLRLCAGRGADASVADSLLPQSCCGVAQAIAAHLLPGGDAYGKIDALVIPTACEWKAGLGNILDAYCSTFRLNDTANASTAVRQLETRRLLSWLEKLTGRRVSADRLKWAADAIRSARAAFRRIRESQKNIPPPITGLDAMLVAATYLRCDAGRWTEACSRLGRELQNRIKNGPEWLENETLGGLRRDMPRVLLAGSPFFWPNWRPVAALERAGCVVVAEDHCGIGRLALSDHELICDFNAAHSCASACGIARTADSCVSLAREMGVQGVVIHQIAGCHAQGFRAKRLAAAMEKAGIQTMILKAPADGRMKQSDMDNLFRKFVEQLSSPTVEAS
ncbi:MAG TPA: 2-hydroxyacyl-CoA dehydratase family protein [Candidatus Brocadiia bacterium]|nr:2-hydroxyacyl-CoA dehydratase family protein [Candidatus Brocadiia bacterium]